MIGAVFICCCHFKVFSVPHVVEECVSSWLVTRQDSQTVPDTSDILRKIFLSSPQAAGSSSVETAA